MNLEELEELSKQYEVPKDWKELIKNKNVYLFWKKEINKQKYEPPHQNYLDKPYKGEIIC